MKDSTAICKFTCVGLLCALTCVDSTFYNRRSRFLNQSTRLNNATVIPKKQNFVRQNNKRTHTNEPFFKEPYFDKLSQKYLRQLQREFTGRSPNPFTDVTPTIRKQPTRTTTIDRTFLSNNRKHSIDSPPSNYQNKFQNGKLALLGGRSGFGPSQQTFPKGARYVKKPIVTQPRRPLPPLHIPETPNHQNPEVFHNHHREPFHTNHQETFQHSHGPFGYHHHYLPDRLGRRPIANCNFQNDMDVTQLFPGLFRSESDVMQQPDMKMSEGKKRPNIKVKELSKVLWCPQDAKKLKREDKQLHNQSVFDLDHQLPTGNIFAAQTIKSKTVESADPVISRKRLSRKRRPRRPCNPRCCRHITGYAPITEVTVDGLKYRAVNTTLLNQYVPVGVCPDTNACNGGLCIQHYLSHWVLIWNNTLSYWPPIQFTRTELPGYCTWENVQLN